MPTWQVRMFAYLRERHGELVSVEAGPTVDAVFDALRSKGVGVDCCRMAVNRSFVRAGHALSDGDDLALIPPVSGG